MTTTLSASITFYQNLKDDTGLEISIEDFLNGVRTDPKWKAYAERVRAIDRDTNPDGYKSKKNEGAFVIVSGRCKDRSEKGLVDPSGVMGIDFDKLNADLERVRELLTQDKYSLAVCKSVGGRGLFVLVRVDAGRWGDSFDGLRDYYAKTYGLVAAFDKGCRNINRLRFVTHDPDLYVAASEPPLFREYPTAKKRREAAKPIGTFIHTGRDIDHLLKQIEERALDITGSYEEWIKLGWSLIAAYGEEARSLFDRLSRFHPDYEERETDRKFDYLLRVNPHTVTISYLYGRCKALGLDVMTDETRDIVSLAALRKKLKVTREGTIDELVKMEKVDRGEAESIVKQVYDAREEIQTDETILDQLKVFIGKNYSIRRNEITRYLENDGRQMQDEDLNDIYLHATNTFNMKVNKPLVLDLLFSSFIPTYHPVKDFFAQYGDRKPFGIIDALADTIKHDHGQTNYVHFFLRKFMVGIVSTVFGEQCPLVPVLTGPPNTGKTQFWRRLFPAELKPYYGESNFNNEKEDEQKMCKKLLLMNDEFTGDLLLKHGKFKSLTDKHTFFLRKPYGRTFEDIPRLAVIAGTSNEERILSDPTGNRRIVPINVISIDHDAYNSIDKVDLIMEAYWAYRDGERSDLTHEQIAFLERHTSRFVDVSIERDLVERYFQIPSNKEEAMLWSQGEILVFLSQMTGIKNLRKKLISQEMKALGFPYSDGDWYPLEKKSKRGFWLYKRSVTEALI